MPRQKQGRIGSRRSQVSHHRESEVPIDQTPKAGNTDANPAPSAATFERLRAVSGAVTRLWKDLGIAPDSRRDVHNEHSHRVALFSWKIARFMGLSDELAERILRGAYLHDVGSVAVPGAVMLKPESLTAEERKSMQVHPRISSELLQAFQPTEDLAGIALSHHERFDGDGYPNGIQGTRIPLEARVLSIADSLDAMMSRRPYRAPIHFSKALREITRQAGKQFDPNIVEAIARQGKTLASFLGAPAVSAELRMTR